MRFYLLEHQSMDTFISSHFDDAHVRKKIHIIFQTPSAILLLLALGVCFYIVISFIFYSRLVYF
ncbi:Uncharacterised protein [Streptococcus acidominimus]|uniref:Uncharacterized protein n=1 Tax=Streptococcus acidominimus TaxID=1326 RepID=A0A380IC76_STRAI|nr:Uncharacterised protein [Streptococcus acidominimus]